MSDETADRGGAGKKRLLAHLEQLRDARLEPSRGLAASVVRSARWQRAVRPYLSAAGGLAAAAGHAARLRFAGRGRA